MRLSLFGLILLLHLPAPGHALPMFVELHATPYLGLNTRLTVQAYFTVPPKWITFHLQRLEAGMPPGEVRIFTVKGRQPPSGKRARSIVLLDDLEASSFEARVETVEFLPLGRYRVVVRDQEGASASIVRDTREFPLLLRRIEHSRVNRSRMQPLSPLPFGQAKGDPLLRGRRIIGIEAKAPKGAVRSVGLQFSWTISPVRPRDFWLYVFDEQRVVWQTRTQKNQVYYGGPRLKPGKTYYWILGGRSESHLLAFERLQGFSVLSP